MEVKIEETQPPTMPQTSEALAMEVGKQSEKAENLEQQVEEIKAGTQETNSQNSDILAELRLMRSEMTQLKQTVGALVMVEVTETETAETETDDETTDDQSAVETKSAESVEVTQTETTQDLPVSTSEVVTETMETAEQGKRSLLEKLGIL